MDFGNVQSIGFYIIVDNTRIFEGLAVRKPGQSSLEVRINDICESYLSSQLPTFVNGRFSTDAIAKEFDICESATDEVVDSVTFTLDYSYDYNRNSNIASSPIVPVVDVNQPFIYSEYEASQIDVQVVTPGGVIDIPIAVARVDDFNNDFNNDFAQSVIGASSGSIYLNLTQFNNPTQVIVGGITYQVVSSCHRFALYYVNGYGGWDSLLMEGRPQESDAITRMNTILSYNNRTPQARGKNNYLNEIVKSFTLRTGFLTDAQSAKMWHLLESTNVYLYDLQTSQMHSVVLTNTDAPFKTFRGEGGKFYQYEVNVELSQSRLRR